MTYTWNQADAGPNMVVDSDYRIYKTNATDFQAIRSKDTLPTIGKWRFSIYKNGPSQFQDLHSPTSFGLYAAADPLQTSTSCGSNCAYIGYTANSYGFDLGGSAWHNSARVGGYFSAINADGEWLTILYDADTGKIWLENSIDGLIGDPEGAGTGEYFSGVPTGLYIGYAGRYETIQGATLATLSADLPSTSTSTFLPLPLPETGTLVLTANNAHSTLASAVSPGDTSFSVAAGEGARFPEVAVPYFMVGMLRKAGFGRPARDEVTEVIIQAHGSGEDTFTCEEIGGTTRFSAGDIFLTGPCAGLFDHYEKRNTSIVVSSDYTIQPWDQVVIVDTDTAGADVTITYPVSTPDHQVMVIATGSYDTILSGSLHENPTPLVEGESIKYIYSDDLSEWRPIDA